ncbi:hypothetical protein, partial [Microbacterium sp. GbtcB4]|uniref:hypothetical protein n=1 Tax=Microbacterium sp. GbtcB4 TaxID=2824749 RepID=UPI001C2F4311
FPEEAPERFTAALKVNLLGSATTLANAWEYTEPGDLVSEAQEIAGEAVPKRKKAGAMRWWQEGHTGVGREGLERERRS